MKRIIFFFFVQLATLFVFAQDGFVNGYIINYKNDTIKGKIKDRKYTNGAGSWQKIRFKNDKGETEKLTPEELLGYVKNDTIIYQTLILGIEEKKTFVERVETGPINMFAYVWAKESGVLDPGSIMGEPLYILYKSTGSRMKGEFYL